QPRRVPALPVIRVDAQPPVHGRRGLEAERSPRAPVDQVRASQVAEVVDLEAGGLVYETRLEARDAATVLAELDLLGMTGQRAAGRVYLVIVAGHLVVVHGTLLRAQDRLGGAGNAGGRKGCPQLVVLAEAVAHVEAGGVCAAVQHGVRPFVECAVHRSRNDANARVAAAQVLLCAQNRVVRAGLDRRVVCAVDVSRYRVHHAERESARGPAGQLGRGRDRRGRRRVAIAVLVEQCGRAADAARVEQPLIRVAVDDDVAV